MTPNGHTMTETQTNPADPLFAFVLSILTPLLATTPLIDATQAARQAIAAYIEAGETNLIAIAQNVGFALASLDNLRLSADPDLSVSMKLKLRGNANALTATSQRSAATPAPRPAPTQPASTQDDTAAQTEALAALDRARADLRKPEPAPRPEQSRERIWASAMTDIAAECSRNLAKLSARDRRTELIRIKALSATASHLANGGATQSKSGLLNTTALGRTAAHS